MENDNFIEPHESGYKVKTSLTDDPIECENQEAIFQKSDDPNYAIMITHKKRCVIGKIFHR